MKKTELVQSLTGLTQHHILGKFATAALALVERSAQIEIVDRGVDTMTDRKYLIDLYSFRKRRVPANAILGFEETIRSLTEQVCDRIGLVTVNLDRESLSLLLTPEGEIVGGYVGKNLASPVKR